MKIIDGIRHAWERRAAQVQDELRVARNNGATGVIMREKDHKALMRAHLIRWANLNRRNRRSYGHRGRSEAATYFAPESSYFVPRYIRRHLSRVRHATRPFTRRMRKARARVDRQYRFNAGVAPKTISLFKSYTRRHRGAA